jgi:hypothetical protein
VLGKLRDDLVDDGAGVGVVEQLLQRRRIEVESSGHVRSFADDDSLRARAPQA